MKLEKNKVNKGSVFYNNTFIPYSIEYIEEDKESLESLFNLKILGVEQIFIESDLKDFFQEAIYTLIDMQIENFLNAKEQITVRLFSSDIDFLKNYGKREGVKYHTYIRDFVHNGVKNLKENELSLSS